MAELTDEWSVFKQPEVMEGYLLHSPDTGYLSASLQVQNIACAGCSHKIETAVLALPGIESAEMNYTSHQLRVSWQPEQTNAADILRKLSDMGYPSHPVRPGQRLSKLDQQFKTLLRQTAVAGALGMQIMVLSVCLYAGDAWGIDPQYKSFFRTACFLLCLPLLLYSGRVFFSGAWRDFSNSNFFDIKSISFGMDVPIALGLTVAWIASSHAWITGQGEIYFDSIAMLIFLLLGARLLELSLRLRANRALGEYDTVLPESALLKQDVEFVHVSRHALKTGDLVRVDMGATVPADGIIETGESTLDESLLSGESLPIVRRQGDTVTAGSVNVESPIDVRISRSGQQTTLAGLARMVEQARFSRPKTSQLVQTLASRFVLAVLLIALLVMLTHLWLGTANWLAITISVLIVSCPCALALATPSAYSHAISQALQHGILINRSDVLERIPHISQLFTDKTGTLTTGEFRLDAVQLTDDASVTHDQVLAIASAMEQFSAHPIAKSLLEYANVPAQNLPEVSEVHVTVGGGVTGLVSGLRYFLGSSAFVESYGLSAPAFAQSEPSVSDAGGTVVLLATEQNILARLVFSDDIRPGMAQLLEEWHADGVQITMLTGDNAASAQRVADELSITRVLANCTPEQKLESLNEARNSNEQANNKSVIAMLGDGLNDAPIIGAVDISIAVDDRLTLTTGNADIVILNSNVSDSMRKLLHLGNDLSRVIKQNLSWALGYNSIAIVIASLGLVPPWLAAIGMSASSLIVTLNASRIGRSMQAASSPENRPATNLRLQQARP